MALRELSIKSRKNDGLSRGPLYYLARSQTGTVGFNVYIWLIEQVVYW
jgi:hypothetical protein